MIIFGQWLLRVVGLCLGAILDRILGLPIITTTLIAVLSRHQQGGWQYGLLVITSLIIAVLFMLPLVFVWGVFWGVYFWIQAGRRLVVSQRWRLVVVVVVSAAIFGVGLNFL